MTDTRPEDAPELPDEPENGAETPESPRAGEMPPTEPAPPEPAPELPELPEPPDSAEPPAPPRGSGRGTTFLAVVAFLLAAAGAAYAGYDWWLGRLAEAGRQAAAEDLRGADAARAQRVAALEQRLASLEREADGRQERLAGLESEVESARSRVADLASGMESPERSPAIADAEHLLVVAGRELALAGNPRVALAALREADERLAALDDPSLLPVRQAISDDVAAVEAAAAEDPDGLALRLGSLAGRVRGLPLVASLAPEPEAAPGAPAGGESGWQRFRRRLGDLASGLFRVRRVDQPAAPLLAPEESFFLQRNVELDLKAARLAALSGDQANYAQSLAAARETVAGYFLVEDPAVESFLAAIDELAARDVSPAWPDVTPTLERLRSLTRIDDTP